MTALQVNFNVSSMQGGTTAGLSVGEWQDQSFQTFILFACRVQTVTKWKQRSHCGVGEGRAQVQNDRVHTREYEQGC
jgi:hypothetical protein